jgi:localization factor PodJL
VARDAARDATRRSGLPVGAAFAMICKDIQELRRQTSRPQIEPAVVEQRLHEIATQIGALQGATTGGAGLDAFLQRLNALLVQNLAMVQQQVATSAANAIRGPAESIRRDVASLKEIQASVDRRTQDTFEAVYSTIERVIDRLTAIEDELSEHKSGSQADFSTPSADERDWPGVPPVRRDFAAEAPALVPADRPASTVVLRQPALPDVAFDAAPRRVQVKPDSDCRRSQFFVPIGAGLAGVRRVAQALAAAFKAAMAIAAVALVRVTSRSRGKVAMFGFGAGLLILLAVTFVADFYGPPAVPPLNPVPIAGAGAYSDRADDQQAHATEARPDQPPPGQEASLNPALTFAPFGANPPVDGPGPAVLAAEAMAAVPVSADAGRNAEVLMQNVLLPAPAGRNPWEQSGPDLTAEPLPPTIGSKTLVAAAAAGDPAAAYEVAIRFARGRNAAPDLARAAAWMERAARAGLAPAQFRLAGMYEKGLGVRRDPAEARRLYTAAAVKGHAKATHNLAVLYVGGVDAAPDYGVAAEWFRKAAVYGNVDSQYNLGILYARGTGVERDLAESYKWFALAAKGGDKEAARKRDEIARELDAKQLESAKANVEAFAAVPQPDEATDVKAPPGGWEQVAAAATTKSRALVRPERFPGR